MMMEEGAGKVKLPTEAEEVEVATFCAKTALPPSDHKHLDVSEPASVAPLCEGPPLQSLLL
jgi:hypothetical protein